MCIQSDPALKATSKFLSLVLRHRPTMLGLIIQEGGWVPVAQLIEGMNSRGQHLTKEDLDFVVANNDKSRYSYDESGTLIRANQGHSVPVDLQLQAISPPTRLFHGTHEGAVSAILREGLRKMKRHHVHLSEAQSTASTVGKRRGHPVILEVDAKAMAERGYAFFRSDNGVWLTEEVPPEFFKPLE